MVLSFLSLNVRGLRNGTKRKAIFLFCKEQPKVNCFFLQETHSVEDDLNFWKSQWGSGDIFLSHGTSHSAGVAIFLNRFEGKVLDQRSDNEGHWLMLNIKVNDSKYILVNVYGHNNRTKNKRLVIQLKTMIQDWVQLFSTDKIIIGGDFNVVPNESKDRFPSQPQPDCLNYVMSEFANPLSLVDIWRIKNPDKIQFTWSNNSKRSQSSRIDYWLISKNLELAATSCEILPSPLTDHCAITLLVSATNDLRGPKVSHWKFNSSLLKNFHFCNRIKELITEIKAMTELTPCSKWEWLKFNVKKISIEEGKAIARMRKQFQDKTISRISSLNNLQQLNEENQLELNQLQIKLDHFYTEKAKGAFVRSRAKWIEDGEKNSNYFFNLEKNRQRKKNILKLHINGNINERQEDINEYITNFYKTLYTSHSSNENISSFFEYIMDKIPVIDKKFKDLAESEISINELNDAIKQMADGRSPGPDGITVEFYKYFWNDISELLLETFKDCIDKQLLSPTMKRGIISLLPKPNKDILLIDNWRPITLLCCDYKILAHVYANRLKTGITQIIDETQSAFIKGRHIHHHTRLILDILDYNYIVPHDSLILFLDFFKAFDSLEHPFLFKTLEAFGFGPKFCNIVRMFYKDINSSIALSQGFSNSFSVNRGIRQGCPISPILFIMAAELLAILFKMPPVIEGINIFDKEFIISQFADDTVLFLKNEHMIPLAINQINMFSKASGLTLNLRKCEILPVHNCRLKSIVSIPVKNEVKYLGLVITKNSADQENANIITRLNDVKKAFSHWLSRDLSILGRILLSKAEGLSRLIYPCHSIFTSKETIQTSNSVIFKFIWRNKTHYIRKSQMIKDYENGGLKAINFESIIAALRAKWLKECLSFTHSMWYHIPNKLFSKVGGLSFLLKCDFDLSKLPLKLSAFHRQALEFGKLLFTHNFTPHNTLLWNNRMITINRKSLFKSDWYEKGICFLHDLLKSNGEMLSYETFVDKFKIKISCEGYEKICKAIPSTLLKLIQNILLYSSITTSLPSLAIDHISLLDRKCNNKWVSRTFNQIIFCNFNINTHQGLDSSFRKKPFTFYLSYPLTPKMKETHFKIISGIYPVADFLHKRFNFELEELCTFCTTEIETIEHLFFSCQHVVKFWTDVHNWISLKINIPRLKLTDVIYFMDNLDSKVSDNINFVIVMGKFFIHTCKWKNSTPVFAAFLNYFTEYFRSLRCARGLNRKALRIYDSIKESLLF